MAHARYHFAWVFILPLRPIAIMAQLQSHLRGTFSHHFHSAAISGAAALEDQRQILEEEGGIDTGATVHLQGWITRSPLRLTAGWAMLAALLSTGFLTNLGAWQTALQWQVLALHLLLVDPLWGGIWSFAWGRDVLLPLGRQQVNRKFWLPYLKPNSPLARLIGLEGERLRESDSGLLTDASEATRVIDDPIPMLFRIGLPTVLLTFGIAATLGAAALWMTTMVLSFATLGWISRRLVGRPFLFLQSVVVISLPWVLAMFAFGASADGVVTSAQRISYSYWLMAFWTIHYWGAHWNRTGVSFRREPQYDAHLAAAEASTALIRSKTEAFRTGFVKIRQRPEILPLLTADLGIASLLIYLREPLWLVLLVPLCLPMWLAYYHGRSLRSQPAWRLTAMLVTGIVVGQTPL